MHVILHSLTGWMLISAYQPMSRRRLDNASPDGIRARRQPEEGSPDQLRHRGRSARQLTIWDFGDLKGRRPRTSRIASRFGKTPSSSGVISARLTVRCALVHEPLAP